MNTTNGGFYGIGVQGVLYAWRNQKTPMEKVSFSVSLAEW